MPTRPTWHNETAPEPEPFYDDEDPISSWDSGWGDDPEPTPSYPDLLTRLATHESTLIPHLPSLQRINTTLPGNTRDELLLQLALSYTISSLHLRQAATILSHLPPTPPT